MPLQLYITQHNGTEDKGSGQYHNFFKEGIYVDIISGEPLFSSRDKYQADSGWPAFTKPIFPGAVNIIELRTWYGATKHRVSSSIAKSHLGDVFLDRFVNSPSDTGDKTPNDLTKPKLRYCINSVALRFIPLAEMNEKGYGQYMKYVIKNKEKNKVTHYKQAIFAGGCFWCIESDFEYFQRHKNLSHGGIVQVISGFSGGSIVNPSYKLVSSGKTDYKESIKVIYDPNKISYKNLVEYFYRRINPTDAKGQFCDKGTQYQSAIYYSTPKQKAIAEAVTKKVKQVMQQEKSKEVYTQILPNTKFYPAETYHQDYHDKHPTKYCYYRTRCGRDATVNKVWRSIKWPYSNVVPFNAPSFSTGCVFR